MSKENSISVSVIPATKRTVKSGGQLKEQKNLRVAAYCRVSTGDESQQTSYTNQKAFYSDYINKKEGWEMAGIYADEAISGTSRAHRKQFNLMIDDALSGRIDYIVTKSISRFARNTIDTLNCVRQLRQLTPPVGIYFEKENIDTLDAAGELILTILSALAQDESRSISDNIRWSFQKNFQAGKPQVNLRRMMGYDKGENEEWIINPLQAQIVRFFFRKYVSGHSASSIARQANEAGMRTVNGRLWTAGAVLDILRNEKYVGDLEMQKTITKDFLSHRSIKNTGEAPKYYVKNHHAAIIDRLTWDKVQIMLDGSREGRTKEGKKGKEGPKASPFFNLSCGEIADGRECGEGFMRMTYSAVAVGYRDERSEGIDHERERERYTFAYPVWRCRRKHAGEARNCCLSAPVRECALEQSFMEMLYRLKQDRECRRENSWLDSEFREAYDRSCRRQIANCYPLVRLELLREQISELEESLKKAEADGNTADREPAADSVRVRGLRLELEELKREQTALEAEQGEAEALKKNYNFFLECLEALPEVNPAGMKLNVYGRNMQHRSMQHKNVQHKNVHTGEEEDPIAQAPDYLTFERGIYAAFIRSGKVRGDEAEYETNFGVYLKSSGNSRTLDSFLGYRRCGEDGSMKLLDTLWKVSKKKIQYRRTERESRRT